MFQQQGRCRSGAVANPSLLEAAVKEKKMALVREANRAVEAAPVPPASRDRNREGRFLLPTWATEDPPRESHFRLKVHEGGNLVEVLQMGEKVAYLLGRHKAQVATVCSSTRQCLASTRPWSTTKTAVCGS